VTVSRRRCQSLEGGQLLLIHSRADGQVYAAAQGPSGGWLCGWRRRREQADEPSNHGKNPFGGRVDAVWLSISIIWLRFRCSCASRIFRRRAKSPTPSTANSDTPLQRPRRRTSGSRCERTGVVNLTGFGENRESGGECAAARAASWSRTYGNHRDGERRAFGAYPSARRVLGANFDRLFRSQPRRFSSGKPKLWARPN